MHMDDSWPAEIPPHWLVYFAVADTDASASRVTDLGGQLSVPPTRHPSRPLRGVQRPERRGVLHHQAFAAAVITAPGFRESPVARAE